MDPDPIRSGSKFCVNIVLPTEFPELLEIHLTLWKEIERLAF